MTTGTTASSAFTLLASPIGTLLVVGTATTLRGVYVADCDHAPPPGGGWVRADEVLAPACRQLREYFAGERTSFDLELETGGTPWQQRVWAALRAIPYGSTCSYGELAREVGAPGAARAVGRANGANPVSIVVPCHRVVAGGGGLGGYGWGLARKTWLLEHEQARVSGSLFAGAAR